MAEKRIMQHNSSSAGFAGTCLQRTTRLTLLRRAMSITSVQYSSGRPLISSDELINCTADRSIPTAFQTWQADYIEGVRCVNGLVLDVLMNECY